MLCGALCSQRFLVGLLRNQIRDAVEQGLSAQWLHHTNLLGHTGNNIATNGQSERERGVENFHTM